MAMVQNFRDEVSSQKVAISQEDSIIEGLDDSKHYRI